MNETNTIKQAKKKKLIFLYDDLQQSDTVCELLSGDYDLLCTQSKEELKMLLRERYREFSAILIGSETAVENNYNVLKEIQKKSKFRLIPVLVFSSGSVSEKVLDCLEYNAADFIVPPYYKKIIKNRIENAIRCRDSASFYEILNPLSRSNERATKKRTIQTVAFA